MPDKDVASKPRGLDVIESVIADIHSLLKELNIKLVKNVIFDVTESVKEAYTADVTEFKVVTSHINFIIKDIVQHSVGIEVVRNSVTYTILVFADSKVDNLEKVNLGEVTELFGVDLMEYTNLSKCNFHFNKLYLESQFNMIPCVEYKIVYSELY
jgi:hypothetical protein